MKDTKEEPGGIVKEADDSLAKDYKPARCFRFLNLVHVRYKEIQHTFPSEDVYFTENGEYRRCLKSGWTRCAGLTIASPKSTFSSGSIDARMSCYVFLTQPRRDLRFFSDGAKSIQHETYTALCKYVRPTPPSEGLAAVRRAKKKKNKQEHNAV